MLAIKKLIPHLFTAGNLLGGIFAIILAIEGYIELAPFCIFISAILDFFDGFMARLLKVPSELGKQLDSLADMVTFGVAPGIIVFQLFRNIASIKGSYLQDGITGTTALSESGMSPSFIFDSGNLSNIFIENPIQLIAFIIPVFALFRLAKFNIDTRQSDSFIGVPTPAMTLFFAAIPLMIQHQSYAWQESITGYVLMNPYFLAGAALIMSILMVVELPLFALKFKNFKWKGNEIRFIFLTICGVLLITLLWWSLPLIIILYVLLSLVLKPKKNEIQS